MARSGVDRGVSEEVGVVALVALTLLVTVSVGIGALVIETEDDLDAEFEFQHAGDVLLVTYEDGPPLVSGALYVDGPANNVSWAALADRDPAVEITPETRQTLRETTPYGAVVESDDTIELVYVPEDGSRTVLATWTGE